MNQQLDSSFSINQFYFVYRMCRQSGIMIQIIFYISELPLWLFSLFCSFAHTVFFPKKGKELHHTTSFSAPHSFSMRVRVNPHLLCNDSCGNIAMDAMNKWRTQWLSWHMVRDWIWVEFNFIMDIIKNWIWVKFNSLEMHCNGKQFKLIKIIGY